MTSDQGHFGMPLDWLTNTELVIVRQCLRAAADGPFFPDCEFQTLIGVTREEVRALAERWEGGAPDGSEFRTAVNVMNNLVGYPHGMHTVWSNHIEAPPDAVEALLRKLMDRHHDVSDDPWST